jgi:hypothetical protein
MDSGLAASTETETGTGFNPTSIGSIAIANSDLAFTGDHVIQGNWRGFQIFDVSDPCGTDAAHRCAVSLASQGDLTVYGNLMFHSVEASSGKIDCTTGGVNASNRFRGVRIWDIGDLDNPVQVGGIQTCRGSHTHRLVEDPNDPDNVYVYVSGTAGQRSSAEFVHTPDGFVNGRCGQTSAAGANPSQWMIEVIKVPVDDAAAAEVVTEARLFQDFETGAVNGLQNSAPPGGHPCNRDTDDPATFCSPAGAGYSPTPNTNTCHDITVYPEIGLAAGACQGNGLLIDISDPANPVRIDAVADENFSYWHSANFKNDGTAVMFTDEWGGGSGRSLRAEPPLELGRERPVRHRGHRPTARSSSSRATTSCPVAQTNQENCVAHQANIVPVPGRDILVQGWYQGGISMFDWTDPVEPVRDRLLRPRADQWGFRERARRFLVGLLVQRSCVWQLRSHRGLDVFDMTPTDHLTQNEIDAANTIVLDEHNAMSLRRFDWEPSSALVRAFADQAEREGLAEDTLANVRRFVDRAEQFASGPQARAAIANLRAVANQVDEAGDFDALAGALRDLADSLS